MKLGYDEIVVTTDHIDDLLLQMKEKHISLYSLRKIDHQVYRFYTPIYQRHKVKACHLSIKRSIGVFHYLLLLVKGDYLFLTLSFILTLMILPSFILKIKIDGPDHQLNQRLSSYLDKQNITILKKQMSYNQIDHLYELIKDDYLKEIDYLNIYQNGCVFHIRYSQAITSQKVKEKYCNIVSKCDAIVQSIEVAQGNILVKVNDYVKKGDILISNEIESTDGKIQMIPTYGIIKGYTYHIYTSSIDLKRLKKEDGFSYLLFKTRMQIPANAKIDKEKVLSYDIIGKKLVLKMYYVFIEEISVEEK